MRKPTKTISGVTPLAVMLKPKKCDHGICTYCPQLNVPQSYTPKSPVVMRASKLNYDAEKQVKARLKAFEVMGHETSKVEMIVMGGTFPSEDEKYQRGFVNSCLDALNGRKSRSLEDAKRANERARNRCTGLTIETRPDFCSERQIEVMLELGTTRVELGVQTTYNDILMNVERGHGVEESILATRLAKDAGLKVCYHMMPGLPGNTPDSDFQDFESLFTDPRLQPDMLKIYPTLVVKNTKLFEWWKEGIYSPYSNDQVVELVTAPMFVIDPVTGATKVTV